MLVKLSSYFASSLIYIRNNSCPNADPWGTPARMDFIDKVQDLRIFFLSSVSYVAT